MNPRREHVADRRARLIRIAEARPEQRLRAYRILISWLFRDRPKVLVRDGYRESAR